jgi:hypothetical protein
VGILKVKRYTDRLNGKTMRRIKQYLPFILWSILTIILTILGFIILPILLLGDRIHCCSRENEVSIVQLNPD